MQYQQREAWTNQYGQQMYSQMPVPAQGGAPGMVGPDGMPVSSYACSIAHLVADMSTKHNSINTVYSFVPIPGAAQHKRPRRRFEEIERMYKCGWQGCEKAYGTLNHLNAHVTMQSHGSKRTPEGKFPIIDLIIADKSRIQGDPQRVEGKEEGGREST